MANQPPELWTTDQVAHHLGYTGERARQTATTMMGRWGISPVSRQPGRTGQNLYNADQVRRADANRSGRGRRTDLHQGQAATPDNTTATKATNDDTS